MDGWDALIGGFTEITWSLEGRMLPWLAIATTQTEATETIVEKG